MNSRAHHSIDVLLKEFLIKTGELCFKDVGMLMLIQISSSKDVYTILPPAYALSWNLPTDESAAIRHTHRLISYLSEQTAIAEEEAEKAIAEYASSINESIEKNGKYIIRHIGILHSIAGFVYIEPYPNVFPILPAISYESASSTLLPPTLDYRQKRFAPIQDNRSLPPTNNSLFIQRQSPPAAHKRTPQPRPIVEKEKSISIDTYPTIVKYLLILLFVLSILIIGFYIVQYSKSRNLLSSLAHAQGISFLY